MLIFGLTRVFKRNKGKCLITSVSFRLSKIFTPDIKYSDLETELSHVSDVNLFAVRGAVISVRARKLPDPSVLGSAGSFFKNPTVDTEKSKEIIRLDPHAPLYPQTDGRWKISAARLIDRCDLKGVRIGRVGTYPNQPLVIVNYGGATGKEVLDFSKKIIDRVNAKFGVRLEPEVNIV